MSGLWRAACGMSLFLYEAIAGYDPSDPFSVNTPVKDVLTHLTEGVQGWRVALARDSYFEDVDLEVLEAVQQAAIRFRGVRGACD